MTSIPDRIHVASSPRPCHHSHHAQAPAMIPGGIATSSHRARRRVNVFIGRVLRSSRGSDEERCRLCYDQHHVETVTVVVTLPALLPGVFRREVEPMGNDSASPALWRHIPRYE